MATNVYDSEQVIHDNGKGEPKRYYGFYLTTSGDSLSAYPFGNAEARERFAARVRALVPDLDEYDARILAGIKAAEFGADDDGTREAAGFMLDTHAADLGVSEEAKEAIEELDADHDTGESSHDCPGYALIESDERGLEVQACDECGRFKVDGVSRDDLAREQYARDLAQGRPEALRIAEALR